MRFTKIDRELSIYKNKKVFLFGASKAGCKCLKKLEQYDIKVQAFIDNNVQKQGTKFEGLDVISLTEVLKLEKSSYIIQIASTYEVEIEKQLKDASCDFESYVLYSEFCKVIKGLQFYNMLKDYPALTQYTFETLYEDNLKRSIRGIDYLSIPRKDDNRVNMLLSAPKTGNVTITSSVENRNSSMIIASHSYANLSPEIKECISDKEQYMVIGVRDAVSQNLSCLFQMSDDWFWDLNEYYDKAKGVQSIFDNYFLNNAGTDTMFGYKRTRGQIPVLVQDFFDLQLKDYEQIDIYKYNFDKEKGYSIYDFENKHILIYQLEKMNGLERVIGDFLNIEDFAIVRDNISENKWYDPYYKEAKKEIKLKRQWFDEVYTGKYMTHFYSDKDILKFRKCWEKNVVD